MNSDIYMHEYRRTVILTVQFIYICIIKNQTLEWINASRLISATFVLSQLLFSNNNVHVCRLVHVEVIQDKMWHATVPCSMELSMKRTRMWVLTYVNIMPDAAYRCTLLSHYSQHYYYYYYHRERQWTCLRSKLSYNFRIWWFHLANYRARAAVRPCFYKNEFYCLFAPYKITRVSFKLDSPYRARQRRCVQGESRCAAVLGLTCVGRIIFVACCQTRNHSCHPYL